MDAQETTLGISQHHQLNSQHRPSTAMSSSIYADGQYDGASEFDSTATSLAPPASSIDSGDASIDHCQSEIPSVPATSHMKVRTRDNHLGQALDSKPRQPHGGGQPADGGAPKKATGSPDRNQVDVPEGRSKFPKGHEGRDED
jgi:hypothetical protein